MAAFLEEVSTITAKGQTTIPKSVRQALGVEQGGKIAFRFDAQGVTVTRVEVEHEDPAVDAFLAFLTFDMKRRPESIATLPSALVERIADLTEGIPVDFSAPIEGVIAF